MTSDSETVRSQLRLPGDLYEKIKSAAARSGRSMNAEIVHRLESSFPEAIEVQLLQTRQRELIRMDEELRSINAQIADLTQQLQQPSKRKLRGQIQETIAALSRRQVDIARIREGMEQDLARLARLPSAR